MGCGNSITSKEYKHTIKIINKCTLENLINIKAYENLYTLFDKKNIKEIITSIIVDKKSQIDILNELYIISSGENLPITNINYTNKYDLKSLLNLTLEREFSYITSLKSLRRSLPTPSLKIAINSLLTDENTILNKLIYTKDYVK